MLRFIENLRKPARFMMIGGLAAFGVLKFIYDIALMSGTAKSGVAIGIFELFILQPLIALAIVALILRRKNLIHFMAMLGVVYCVLSRVLGIGSHFGAIADLGFIADKPLQVCTAFSYVFYGFAGLAFLGALVLAILPNIFPKTAKLSKIIIFLIAGAAPFYMMAMFMGYPYMSVANYGWGNYVNGIAEDIVIPFILFFATVRFLELPEEPKPEEITVDLNK